MIIQSPSTGEFSLRTHGAGIFFNRMNCKS